MKLTKKMLKLKTWANSIVLEDDDTDTGGISYMDERLDNFLDEVEISYDASEEEINNALIDCGIVPLTSEQFNARKEILK